MQLENKSLTEEFDRSDEIMILVNMVCVLGLAKSIAFDEVNGKQGKAFILENVT